MLNRYDPFLTRCCYEIIKPGFSFGSHYGLGLYCMVHCMQVQYMLQQFCMSVCLSHLCIVLQWSFPTCLLHTGWEVLHMPPLGQTDRQRHYTFYLSVRLFVCYQTCEYYILTTNEPIFVQVGTRSPSGKSMKWSTFQLWYQEVKHQGHTRLK